jgi:hypothetical protein
MYNFPEREFHPKTSFIAIPPVTINTKLRLISIEARLLIEDAAINNAMGKMIFAAVTLLKDN